MTPEREAERVESLAQEFVRMFGREPDEQRRQLFDEYATLHVLHGRERECVAMRVAGLIDGWEVKP